MIIMAPKTPTQISTTRKPLGFGKAGGGRGGELFSASGQGVSKVEPIVLMTVVPLAVMVLGLELGCAVMVTGCVLPLHVFVGGDILSAALDGDASIRPTDDILLLIALKPWSRDADSEEALGGNAPTPCFERATVRGFTLSISSWPP